MCKKSSGQVYLTALPQLLSSGFITFPSVSKCMWQRFQFTFSFPLIIYPFTSLRPQAFMAYILPKRRILTLSHHSKHTHASLLRTPHFYQRHASCPQRLAASRRLRGVSKETQS